MNRTEMAIIDCFWELLEEKPYNKITVKKMIERCHVCLLYTSVGPLKRQSSSLFYTRTTLYSVKCILRCWQVFRLKFNVFASSQFLSDILH